MDIVLRREAKKQGLEFYFTGQPCSRGEVAKRRTSNGVCQCALCQSHTQDNENRRNRYACDEAYRENKKEIAKRARDRDKERTREWARAYRRRNREAVNASNRDWYQSKPDDERKEYSRAKYYKSLSRSMLANAKRRANKNNVPFNLVLGDINIPDSCPVMGVPFEWGDGFNDYSPTLDRIVPSLGYVAGNVHVISNIANRIKSNATPEQVKKVYEYFLHLQASSSTHLTEESSVNAGE